MTSSQPTKVGGFLDEDTLLEEIAELEHQLWWNWSESIISFCMDNSHSPFDWGIKIQQKHERWLPMWKHYDELSEDLKEHDRIWARKVLDIVKRAKARRAPPISKGVGIRTEDTL